MVLSDGTIVQLRPIHPKDIENADRFRISLSNESIYNRFFGYNPAANEKLKKRLIEIDYVTEMAIIGEIKGDPKEVIVVARLVAEDQKMAEYAIIIADDWQGKGLGKLLTKYVIEIAADMKFQKVCATILTQNTAMLEILRKLDFDLKPEDDQTILAIKEL
jgi:acetyltransferase